MDTIKWTNVCTKTVVRRMREKKTKDSSEETMVWNPPNLQNNIDMHIHKVQQTPNKKIQRPTLRLIIIKLLKVK